MILKKTSHLTNKKTQQRGKNWRLLNPQLLEWNQINVQTLTISKILTKTFPMQIVEEWKIKRDFPVTPMKTHMTKKHQPKKNIICINNVKTIVRRVIRTITVVRECRAKIITSIKHFLLTNSIRRLLNQWWWINNFYRMQEMVDIRQDVQLLIKVLMWIIKVLQWTILCLKVKDQTPAGKFILLTDNDLWPRSVVLLHLVRIWW